MNFRCSIQSPPVAFQIAPLVDILLFLVIFFLITWNFSRSETELDIKVPTASEGQETRRMAAKVIVNIKPDGSVVMNRRSMDSAQLLEALKKIVALYPDQAVILRADESTDYRYVVGVLDACRQANILNIAFATNRTQ
ncbi:MAG: biopolymer transporter ExbD [bacterium]